MKKLVFILFAVLLCNAVYADDGKSFISLRSGVSLPFGNYSMNSLEIGCFTTTGVSFGADGAWFFWKNLGVGLDVNYSLHTVDAIGLATEMVRVDPFLVDMNVRSEPYTMLTTMSGLYYSFTISNRINVQPRLLGGIIFGSTPYQLFEQTYLFPGPNYYKSTSSRDKSFAFKTGISINYDISSCIGLSINADYTHSDLSFGFYTSNGFEYRNRKISYIDFGLGLVINL